MFGYPVPVLVKDLAEMETVLNNNPFVNERNSEIKSLHVTFLSRVPEPADLAKLTVQAGNDEFIISGNVIYLYCPDGIWQDKAVQLIFREQIKDRRYYPELEVDHGTCESCKGNVDTDKLKQYNLLTSCKSFLIKRA